MKAYEHRAIGDEATSGALVDVGPVEEPFLLRYGDVIALSGDFFLAEAPSPGWDRPSTLFEVAALPGDRGRLAGTRDEVVCALKVMAVDEGVSDARFDPPGEFADFAFHPTAARSEVERRVRDRFLWLAAANDDHFVAPWGDVAPMTHAEIARGSAPATYRRLHQVALDHAFLLGSAGGQLSRAMAREAAAQHYLTDSIASGHLRTPIAAIRRFWHERYPHFWESLQTKIAGDTAAALRELCRPFCLLPRHTLNEHCLAAVRTRTRHFPPVSMGDLLGRVFHDWDNEHGLILEDGSMLYGDGRLDDGVGRRLAVAAVRAGNDEVEVAFRMGASGRRLSGEPLYQAVRDATGGGAAFGAERYRPRPSSANPPLNWRADDLDELWRSPVAGSTGVTVGQAVAEVLAPGGEVARRLDCLGEGVVDALELPNVPVLRNWLSRKACQAYHRGFIETLAREPWSSITAVIDSAVPAATAPLSASRV